jgi:hypothetical protein
LAELCESDQRQVTECCGRPSGRFAETRNGSRWPTRDSDHRQLRGSPIRLPPEPYKQDGSRFPHETKAYANANSHPYRPQPLVLQGLQKSVPNSRSQEVWRISACKNRKRARNDDFGVTEVRSFKRKTPQTLACSGVSVSVIDSLLPMFWRGRGIRTVDSEVPFCRIAINHLQIRTKFYFPSGFQNRLENSLVNPAP